MLLTDECPGVSLGHLDDKLGTIDFAESSWSPKIPS
jgi:hypothetical protein